MLKFKLILLFFFIAEIELSAQCGVPISSFPYFEGFELSNGGWISGGTGNDWAWGSPSKAFITSAGSGSKCWVTGGLSGSFYTNGERSYVNTPCFNFSLLVNPVVSFKIYWDSENIYDGATFQSSLDNGATWTNVGTDNDPPSCLSQNWFNQSNINNLNTLANPKHGWAGSSLASSGSCVGGNGSNGWVLAKHCLSNLAGQTSVKFRFAFGAGTACNNFDGIAFDDFKIEDAPVTVANFTYSCTSNFSEYQFTNTSSSCPTNHVWNFGDPASGANNGTGLQNPTHTFSGPGTYLVTLTESGPCNSSSTITKTLITINANLTSINLTCNNSNNGAINATALNGIGIINYILQPLGINNLTGNFTGLSIGTYTVNITDAIGCSFTSTATISAPPSLNWNLFTPTNISCHGLQDGKISASVLGGIAAISYTLMPGSLTNFSGNFINLTSNNYTVIATDANGCTLTSSATIMNPNLISLLSSNQQNINCFGNNDGGLDISCSGGIGVLNYQINPGGQSNTSGSFINLSGGFYTITCTDLNGCSISASFILTEPTELKFDSIATKQPDCNPNNNGIITISASGGVLPYQYSIGGVFGSNTIYTSLTSNNYTITVKDSNGCTKSSITNLQSIDAPIFNPVISKDISCAGKKDGNIQVSAIGNAAIQNYAISPGSTINSSGEFSALTANTYVITASDINGCTNTTSVVINSPMPLVIENLDYQLDSCQGKSGGKLTCNAKGGTGLYTYEINPGTVTQNINTFTNLPSGQYIVKVVDANACTTISTITIPEKICCDEIFVPNAFSPNNDGRNEEFGIKRIIGIEIKEFLILNRWGQIVFKSQNQFDTWNGHYKGEDAEIGTYFYYINYRCLLTNKMHELKGDLILLR